MPRTGGKRGGRDRRKGASRTGTNTVGLDYGLGRGGKLTRLGMAVGRRTIWLGIWRGGWFPLFYCPG